MYDQLPILLQLQEIDNEIGKLESRKSEIPRGLKVLETRQEKLSELLKSKSETLEELQKDRRSKDRQLTTQQAQLEKYKSQRLTVKTNKEYTALESEISELEAANSGIEDEILELMISIDEANDTLEIAKRDLKAQENIIEKKRNKLLSEARKLDQEIALWDGKRGEFLGKISPALMSKYDSWRNHGGRSLVAVIDNGSCGGCHLKLPPQLINEVRKKERLYTCNSCGRILYWQEEIEKIESEEQ